jgi:hypothetical protein
LNHRKRFSLLVVRGDGVRVLRIGFSRRFLFGCGVAVLAGVSVLGALAGDWWQTRQRMRDSGTLFQQLDHQRAIIDDFNTRVAELRKEVGSWRELHAKIWEPFGPDMAPKGSGTGIGGRTVPAETRDSRPTAADELNRLSESVVEEGQSLRALERLISKAGKALASLPSRWPLRGAVNSEFGGRQSPWTKGSEFHGGIDIAAERGTAVRAPSAGTVVFAGPQAEYGMTVIIEHSADIKSIYGHLGKILVRVGQRVERGADIGFSGNTGRSSGPHLHYEILVKGQPVNPRAYLWD